MKSIEKYLSSRLKLLGTESAFEILKEVNELTVKGKKIINFCIGQPDFNTPKHICDATKEAIDSGHHGYTQSSGIVELRRSVAKFFTQTRHNTYSPEDIVISCGAKPFIWYSIFILTDPGINDEVIFPNPGYPIYESMIRGLGATPVALNLLESHQFGFDPDELRKLISPRTKLLILNSPHNPTGGVLSNDILEAIAEICLEHDLWVYSDEIYSNLVFDQRFTSISSYANMKNRTITVDCVSKTFAMTGWRIGYMANSVLAPIMARMVTNSDSCAAHPNQWAAVAALEGSQAEAMEMFRIFKERRDVIVPGLNKIHGIECLKPGGAFYVWPNVTEACKMVGCKNSEEFRKRLLYEAGVACLSDRHFGHPIKGEGQHIRISYASGAEEIREGLARIDEFIRKNKT